MDAAMPPVSPASPASHQSVGSLAAAFWRRKFWILLPTLLAFLASMAVVNILRVRYTGEARVLLENRETVYSRPDRDTRGSEPAIDPEQVASQVQVVQSKDLALKVIRDMKLGERDEFDPVARGVGISGSVLMALGLAPDPRSIPKEERVLDVFRKRLLVFPQGKSRVISIEFQSESPELAAEIANRIAAEYLLREESAKSETGRVTSEWLDKAIEPLVRKVQEAEGRVEAFRAKKGLFIGTNNMTITSQQLAEMNSQLATARTQQADLQSRAKLIREAVRLGRVFETSEINNNELVRRLLEQRAALKAQIAFEERTLLPGHPRMKELGSQLRDLESQVRSAAERAARSFENDARAAGARVQSIQAELNSQKKSAALSNEDEVQLKALEREAASLREQLTSYRTKFLDAAARSGDRISPADARIISRAFAQNEPTFPKKVPIVLLATLGTLVICLALVASGHLMARQAALGGADFAYAYPGYPPLPDAASLAAGPMGVGQPPQPALQQAPPVVPERRSIFSEIKTRFANKRVKAPVDDATQPAWVRQAQGFRHAQAAPVEMPPMQGADALGNRPAMQAAEDIARELAMLGYLGRGKVLVVHGAEGDARTALHAMRYGRRLVREGAAVVLDLVGLSDLYPRVLGQGLPGLADYLRGECSLGEIIHRDPKSPLDVVVAGAGLMRQVHASATRDELLGVIDALSEAYGFVIIDAGPAGGAGEVTAGHADLFALLTRRHPDDDALLVISERLEAVRGASVVLVPDDVAPVGAPGASNGLVSFGRA